MEKKQTKKYRDKRIYKPLRKGENVIKAKVDTDLCIGCTLCTQTCPQVFRMEGDKAVAFVGIVPKEAEDTCK